MSHAVNQGRANHRIVVVEDEPDIADLLTLYFEREGWTVHWCADGESASRPSELGNPIWWFSTSVCRA